MSTCFDEIVKRPSLIIGLTVVTLGLPVIGYLAYRLVQWISHTELFEKISNCFKKHCGCTPNQQEMCSHLVGKKVTVEKLAKIPKPNPISPVEMGIKTHPISTLPQPDSTIVPKKAPGNVFKSKFPRPTFALPGSPLEEAAKFNAECSKLQTFLRLKRNSDSDLIYVCMGHGDVAEQLWPGFVLEQLQNGKTVHSLLFEQGDPLRTHRAVERLQAAYRKYPHANSRLYEHLDNCFSVDQFLCGIPKTNDRTFEDLTEQEKNNVECTFSYYWKTKEQVHEVHENFQGYIEILLKQGKQIVLSDHSSAISPSDYMVKVYNTLLEKYPTQLYFLWGWQNANAMTNQFILSADTLMKRHKPQGTIWTHYPKETGGLYRCTLPLG